jgi:hypothetical protein
MRRRRVARTGRSGAALGLILTAVSLLLVAFLLPGCSQATSSNKPMTVRSYVADYDPAFLTLGSMAAQGLLPQHG